MRSPRKIEVMKIERLTCFPPAMIENTVVLWCRFLRFLAILTLRLYFIYRRLGHCPKLGQHDWKEEIRQTWQNSEGCEKISGSKGCDSGNSLATSSCFVRQLRQFQDAKEEVCKKITCDIYQSTFDEEVDSVRILAAILSA